jgi:hypothetical protein
MTFDGKVVTFVLSQLSSNPQSRKDVQWTLLELSQLAKASMVGSGIDSSVIELSFLPFVSFSVAASESGKLAN